MYLALLKALKNNEPLIPDNWKVVEKHLGTLLGGQDSRNALDQFLETFPQARKKLHENPENYLAAAFASKNTVLYEYLLEHLPANFNPWEYNKQRNYQPLFDAIYQGNEPLVKELLPLMREEDAMQMATTKLHISTNFKWPLIISDAPKERLHAIGNAALSLVSAVPEKYRTPLICCEDFALLGAPIMNNDADIFRQFINMLPSGAVKSLVQTFGFEMNHATYGPKRGDSTKIIDIVTEKIGVDSLVNARVKPPKLYKNRSDRSPEDSALFDAPLGRMIFSPMRKPYPAKYLQHILDKMPQEQVDRFLSLAGYYPFCDAMRLALEDRFRVFYQALSREKREALFNNESVVQTAKMLAYLEDDVMFHSLQDILPESYINMITEKRPTLVNPENDRMVRENHAKYLKRREDRIEIYEPEDVKTLKTHPAFNAALYEKLLPLTAIAKRLENYGGNSDIAAAKLAVLFDKYSQVSSYLDRMIGGYGGEYTQWMHDATLFDIPKGEFNVEHWRRLVTDFGPAASRFLGLADKIDDYSAQHGMDLPKNPKEIGEIARYVAYKRGAERPQFAKECVMFGITEEKFNRILDLLNNELKVKGRNGEKPIILKTETLVPNIIIDGNEIGLPGFTMRKLDLVSSAEHEIAERSEHCTLTAREIASILGKVSRCCQSIGDAGEIFTLHGMTSKCSDFYVWTKRMPNGVERIVAQSWAWVKNGVTKSITFDSIEPLGTAYNHIFTPFMKEFADRAIKEFGYKCVTIGKGGKTPKNLPFNTAQNPLRLNDIDFDATGADYDSKEQWIVR